MSTTDTTYGELVAAVDRTLSTHQDFGDSAAIEQRNLARLRLGLGLLSGTDATADAAPDGPGRALADLGAADDETLIPLLRDPVLRNAFERDLSDLATADLATAGRRSAPAGTLAGLLPSAGLGSGTGPSERLAGHGAKAWPEQGAAWVWQPFDRAEPAYGVRLDRMLTEVFPAADDQAPIEVTDRTLRDLARAGRLLTELLPGVGPQVLRNIGTVGLARQRSVEGGLLSMSGGDGMPATMFIGPDHVGNPWDAAGLILHEGLHLTLFEVIRCGTMLTGDATGVSDLPIPWRTLDWSSARVLFALHVYVHMALYEAAVDAAGDDLRAEYGEPPADAGTAPHTPGSQTGYDTSLARAGHLAELLERRYPDRVTPYGRRFVGWLVDALERLHPGVRDSWTHPAPAPPTPATTAPAPLPEGTFHVVPARTIPLADQRRLAVATTEPPAVDWLNVQLWTLLALCDGLDLRGVQTRYAEAVAGTPGAPHADTDATTGLRDLLRAGLVTITP